MDLRDLTGFAFFVAVVLVVVWAAQSGSRRFQRRLIRDQEEAFQAQKDALQVQQRDAERYAALFERQAVALERIAGLLESERKPAPQTANGSSEHGK